MAGGSGRARTRDQPFDSARATLPLREQPFRCALGHCLGRSGFYVSHEVGEDEQEEPAGGVTCCCFVNCPVFPTHEAL